MKRNREGVEMSDEMFEMMAIRDWCRTFILNLDFDGDDEMNLEADKLAAEFERVAKEAVDSYKMRLGMTEMPHILSVENHVHQNSPCKVCGAELQSCKGTTMVGVQWVYG